MYKGVFCVHKQGFLMPGHIMVTLPLLYTVATYIEHNDRVSHSDSILP